MRLILLTCAALMLAGCAVAPAPTASDGGESAAARTPVSASLPTPRAAANNFVAVVDQVEPVAERICRAEIPGERCDFQIVVDTREGQPPNAFQTLDRNGRPIIAFTAALIADARNQDELAFILGHEAAHHIAGHIPKAQETAIRGALLAGVLTALTGADAQVVQTAQDVGAQVGARAYSKDFELEADALGTVIAFRAGFDPEVGARYFNRIADPGNRFLGTHPPNAARIETVRRTMEQLR